MVFVTGLAISTNWKRDSYDSILVIVDRLTKMVYYKPIKITINASRLAEVIINVVVRHYSLSNLIMTDKGSLFTGKFWSLFCYFFGIRRRLSTAFHPQTDGQTKRQNSIIEVYLKAVVNFEQNDWARLPPIAKFAYNNAKNASTGHTFLELNYGYHFWVFYKEDINPRSKSKLAEELLVELRELMTVCRQNLYHAQELQKQAHDKNVKLKSYATGDKVWLNSKYLKIKQNRKLKVKFFEPFRVVHPVGKQIYKLELLKKWKIYNVIYVLLLEQDITKKEQVDKKVTELDFEAGNSEEYKVEAIWDSTVYAKESKDHLPKLYYLVVWKGYPKEENIWEPVSAIQHLRKLISSFHKDHSEKPTATFPPIDFVLPMARPTVKLARPITKRKWGWSTKSNNKRAKKNWTFCLFSHVTSSRPWFLSFIKKRRFFPSNLSYQVGRFFTINSLLNNFSYCWFSLFSCYWVRRFFLLTISFGFFLPLAYGAKRFLAPIEPLVFLPLFPLG